MELDNIIKDMRELDVSAKTDTKQNLTYLSWSFAWDEVLKIHPETKYEVIKQPDGKPYLVDENFGIMVFTKVTIKETTHEMWLPVMDGANQAMKLKPYTYKTYKGEKECKAATMFDINKTIMRCLVKNLAMFGLGLYIYAGEDLPDAPKQSLSEEGLKKAIEWIKQGKTSLRVIQQKYNVSASQIEEINKIKGK